MKVTSEMKTYAIHWKCSQTGRIGTGTMRFEKEEAERLALELNEKFPDIDHEAVIPAPPSAEPAQTLKAEDGDTLRQPTSAS